jgi:hypothetical protein
VRVNKRPQSDPPPTSGNGGSILQSGPLPMDGSDDRLHQLVLVQWGGWSRLRLLTRHPSRHQSHTDHAALDFAEISISPASEVGTFTGWRHIRKTPGNPGKETGRNPHS